VIRLTRSLLVAVVSTSPILFAAACINANPPSGDDGSNSSGAGNSDGSGGNGSGASTGASKQNLCYGPFDCNGETLDEKCFSSQDSYCASLCNEDNCVAAISCKSDCQ
jgi:hypothetical protein